MEEQVACSRLLEIHQTRRNDRNKKRLFVKVVIMEGGDVHNKGLAVTLASLGWCM